MTKTAGLGYLAIALSVATSSLSVDAAVVVFKSTDAAGRVTYSDLPVDNALELELIELKGSEPRDPGLADKRFRQLVATTARLREDRLARELSRGETRQTTSEAVVNYSPMIESYDHHHYRRPHPRLPHPAFNALYGHRNDHSDFRQPFTIDFGFRTRNFGVSLHSGSSSRQFDHHIDRQHSYSPLRQRFRSGTNRLRREISN
jgi:hypothetical protein